MSAPTEGLGERAETIGGLFDDVAELYDRLADRMSAAPGLHDWLRARLPGGRRALEVGCGTGRFCPLLAETYEEVLGIDPAGALLDIGRRTNARPNIRYEERSAYDVTAERDGRFDLVFAYSAVFHMRPYEAILPHLRSLVAPGGLVVVFETQRPELGGEDGKDAEALTDFAFYSARTAYRMLGTVEASADALRLFLHPSWRRLLTDSPPPTREEIYEAYPRWLPGVELAEGLVAAMTVAVWQAPSA